MEERRSEDRHSIDSLEYITLPAGNGGIVLDVSYGGLGVQTVAALQPSSTIEFSVAVSQHESPIEGLVEVMWSTPSLRAGLRMAQVPDVMQRIAEWISTLTAKQENGSGIAGDQVPGMPTPRLKASAQPATMTPRTNVDIPGASSTSATTDATGPFALTETAIQTHAKEKGWGVYALGRFEYNRFLVLRLGRSSDLGNELCNYLGQYEGFDIQFCASEKRAFHQECEWYHLLRPAENKFHPRKPADTDWDCPVCGGFS